MLLPLSLLLGCGASAGGLAVGGNVVIVLSPPADLSIEPPDGLVQITKRDSDLPGEDREERNLGKLGFGGELRADLGKGAHVIDAIGELRAHPGCDAFVDPERPQSQCYEYGWSGYTTVGVRGPDWEEGTNVEFTVAEGESITVTIELVPSCECT